MSFVWKKVLACALVPSALLVVASVAPPAAGRAQRGAPAATAALYRKHCASCHGRDGRARTSEGKLSKARDLTVAPWQETVTDERLFNTITHGLRRMPAFGEKLSRRQIESLVYHVRRLKR